MSSDTVLPVAIVDGTPNHAKLHRDANGQINYLTGQLVGIESPTDAVLAAEAAQAAAETALDLAQAAQAAAAAAAAQATDISGIDTPDALVAELVDGPSATATALLASIADAVPLAPAVLGPNLQSYLLGQAVHKLRAGVATTIVARGDSLTYGQDSSSGDAVGPPSGALPDGSIHYFNRSPHPWPAVLGEHLNAIYDATVTVINQGYSGDHIAAGLGRWVSASPTGFGADITIHAYGTNDAQADYVPDAIRGNYLRFVADEEKMILRDLGWGSAVIIMLPPRQKGAYYGNLAIDGFRNALWAIANKYGIPVIDAETFLAAASLDCWSDDIHLNTKGYGIIAARLTAVLVGESPERPMQISGGSKLLTRPTLDNCVLADAAYLGSSVGFPTPDEKANGQGLAAIMGGGVGAVHWGIYTTTPDVVVHPWYYATNPSGSGGPLTITLEVDFGVEQGDNYFDPAVNASQSYTDLTPSSGAHVMAAGEADYYPNTPYTTTATEQVRIVNPGWHVLTLRISGPASSTVFGFGVEAFDYRFLKLARG